MIDPPRIGTPAVRSWHVVILYHGADGKLESEYLNVKGDVRDRRRAARHALDEVSSMSGQPLAALRALVWRVEPITVDGADLE